MEKSKYIDAFCMAVVGFFLVSCSAPIHKAAVDNTMQGRIVWPGEPERTRIRYLWSLMDVGIENKENKDDFAEMVFGDDVDAFPDVQESRVLLRPQGIYADEKKIYIADPGAARFTLIDRDTMNVMNITTAGDETLQYPRGISADSAGNIYAVDSDMKKVFSYAPDGKFRYFFDGEFQRPNGIAVDSTREVAYVSDTDAHKLYIYGLDGKFRTALGGRGAGDGEFYYPSFVSVDGSGMIYVTDFMNFRVQFFSPEGVFLGKIGSLGDSIETLDKPKGVATDSEGHIYVVDGIQHMVKIFDREGRLLLFFGEKGEQFGQFWLPSGIYIDSKNVIYVADSFNMRIQAFQFLGGN